MELFATLLLALPTIFLAAFLAAVLENTRERLRTRKWVIRNLRELVVAATKNDPAAWEEMAAAVRRWLAAETPDDLDERAWRQIWFGSFSNAPDLSPMVRSSAAISVRPDVLTALHHLEEQATTLKQLESYLHDLFGRDIAPLWYERRVPLTGSDRHRVTWYADLLASYRQAVERTHHALAQFRTAITS